MKPHRLATACGAFLRRALGPVILSLCMQAPAWAQQLTLDSCQALARGNYPLIRQYDLIEKSKEYTLSNASKAYLPQFSVTGIGAYVFGDLPSFSAPGGVGQETNPLQFIGLAQLNQAIWDGGATGAQKKVITASSEADKASLEVALYELRSRVNQLYFGILLVDEQLKQLEVQDAILSHNVSRVQQLSDNGLVYRTDLDEIRVSQLQLNQRRMELQYVRRGYVDMLGLLTGRQAAGGRRQEADGIQLVKPVLEDDPDLTIARPELALYASQRTLVDAQLTAQETGLMPRIGLLGAGVLIEPGIGLGNDKINFLGVAGLSINWSIGGLYRHGNDKGLAQQSLDRIGVQEQTFLFNTNIAVAQASANIAKQRAVLAEDGEIVQLRQRVREGYELRYSNGAASLIDLLNATEREGEARSQQALHEMQLLAAIAEQQTLTGHQ